ncbi:hypothetical protein TSUD_214090, partial [Trifolium subterraneum]
MDSLEHDTYGLGDIVLFGNNKRMKLSSHSGLDNVFLDNRVENLIKCYHPTTGWKTNMQCMIELLESMEEKFALSKTFDYKEEFGKQRENLKFLMQILYTHMPTSRIADQCDFGRSLFERLVMLGYERKMLNVQYRMHPSISLFPSKEFYDGKLSDASVVREESYNKLFLEGEMYSSYSFINIANGIEQFGDGQSLKNMVE